jgi:uncharacterized membrane protein
VTAKTLLLAAFFCLLPVSELRGGLPYALSHGISLIPAYLFCVILNILVGPLVFLFLSTLHRLLSHLRGYRYLFEKIVERARKKLKDKVDRYGYWGIVVFVGIPLPVTGAYTGALGAWILGMEPKKSTLFIAIGVLAAGVIVSVVYYLVTELGMEGIRIFIKS